MPTASDSHAFNATAGAAAARSFAYRFLAEAFAFPEPDGWRWVTDGATREALAEAIHVAWAGVPELEAMAGVAARSVAGVGLDRARADHLRAFGYTIRGACPPHEIEYGDNKADALFRPHRLADLSALYRAFGTEVHEDLHERQDHLAIECEFASILAARSAHAIETGNADGSAACEGAWRLFLREHLGRWIQAFASRLEASGPAAWMRDAVALLLGIVRADCATLGIVPGSADIQLVSYDARDGDLCTEECGLAGGRLGGMPPA